eukprot:scaffold1_cov375-Pavlova_lutheri.AAC.38
MYFKLPREKAGEAGWFVSESFSRTFSGLLRGLKRGVLRLPTTRDTVRKLPMVFKCSCRVEMARQARGRGAVSFSRVKQVLSILRQRRPLRATIGRSGPSGASLRTNGCWWSHGPRVPIGRFSTELAIHRTWPDNILTLRCPFKDSERFALLCGWAGSSADGGVVRKMGFTKMLQVGEMLELRTINLPYPILYEGPCVLYIGQSS